MRPTIIIGEAHLDPAARQLVHDNLEFFENEGYNTFSFEHDTDVNLASEIHYLQEHMALSDLFLAFAPSDVKRADLLTLCSVPSNRVLLSLFNKIKSSSKMQYQGLDNLGVKNRWVKSGEEIIKLATPEKNELREQNMVNELLQISEQGSGLAIVGLSHVKGIQDKIINKIGLEEARKRFVVLVPFSYIIPSSQLDKITSLVYERNFSELQKLFPLGKCNLFGTAPSSMADYGLSLGERFNLFVKKECFGDNVKHKDVNYCRQYTNYLLSFFTPSREQHGEAINEFEAIVRSM